MIIPTVDPIAVKPANNETKATYNGSSTKACELTCSAAGNAIIVSFGATVVSGGDVTTIEISVVGRTLGADVASNVTGASFDVIAFVVPGDVVDGRTAVFAFTVLAASVILEDEFKTKVVVVGVSYTDAVSVIVGDTYVSRKGETVVFFDDFDDWYVAAVVVR